MFPSLQELTVEMFQAPSSDEEEVAEERPDTGEKMYESQVRAL